MDPTTTLAALLTAAGAGIGALIVRQLVELLKYAFPGLDARVPGIRQAFFLSAVLYLVAYLSGGLFTADAAFGAFVAWLACATASVGLDQVISRTPKLDAVLSRPAPAPAFPATETTIDPGTFGTH